MAVADQTMIIGFIRTTHGLAGKVKVESTSGEFEHFLKLTEVTVKKDNAEKQLAVSGVEYGGIDLYMTFEGIDSIEKAKTIVGWQIVVDKSMACPLYEGEFYQEDLKKCSLVYYENGESPTEAKVVGKITDVLGGGADDLLKVEVSESLTADSIGTDKKRTVLVPFRKEFIGTVDIENGIVQLMHLWILD